MAARKKVTSKAPTRRAASPLGGRSVRRAPKKSAVKKSDMDDVSAGAGKNDDPE